MNLLERATAIGVEGFLHCEELEMLADLACHKDVLEVGSFRGLSAWGMAHTAKSLLCVDTFRANSAGQQQMQELTTLNDFSAAVGRFKNVKVIIGTSEEAKGQIPDRMFDFVFLDAMHTYDDVKADIARWWPAVVPGGVMAFHDYGHHDFPGVKRAVDEVLGQPDRVIITLGIINKPA